MSLTIIKSPPVIIAVNMPVVFALQTTKTDYCHIVAGLDSFVESVEPDNNHKVTFELSDYLKSIPALSFINNLPYVHADACPVQQFIFAERYGAPPANNNQIQSIEYRLLAASVPFWKLDFMGTISDFLTDQEGHFLTWYPANKTRKVVTDEMIHLYFLHTNENTRELKLRFSVVFSDETTADYYGSSISVDANQLVQFDASTQVVLDLADSSGKTIDKYSVSVVFEENSVITSISESRSFKLNYLPFENTRQIVFRNSFGTFDQLLLKGSSSIIGTAEKLTAAQQANYDASPIPDKVVWHAKGRQLLTTETGYLTTEELIWLNELLISKEIYEINGNTQTQLRLVTEKLPQYDDSSYFISAVLEFDVLQTIKVNG